MVLILYQAPLAWLQHVWLQDVLAQPVGEQNAQVGVLLRLACTLEPCDVLLCVDS